MGRDHRGVQGRVRRWPLAAMAVLIAAAPSCEGAGGDDRPPNAVRARPSIDRLQPVPQPPPPPAPSAEPTAGGQPRTKPALAKYIGKIRGGALWSHQARLGVLDFDRGNDRLVVDMPRHETIRCAAASADGSLLAAVSRSGSTALWNEHGALLADAPGRTAVDACSDREFVFSTASERVVVEAGEARLLGKGVNVALGKNIFSPTFSADGRKLFVKISPTDAVAERVNVYATSDGTQLKTLPGSFERLAMSDDGRFVALQRDDQVDLYHTASLRIRHSVDGQSPAFHRDMLVVKSPSGAGKYDDSTAYELGRFTKRWKQRQMAVFHDSESAAPDGAANSSPWRVGSSRRGYSVFDVRTGSTLASWAGSGYGCGYQWLWEKGKLIFIEGNLVTFWSPGRRAKTHTLKCEGALGPIVSENRERFIGLSSVWDLDAGRQLVTLEMSHGASVEGFTKDGRRIIGSGAVGEDPSARFLAWSAETGKVLWHRDGEQLGSATDRVDWYISDTADSAVFVDTKSGSFRHFARVVEAEVVQRLVFDDKCWAGPTQLPEQLPANMPSKHCPQLAVAVEQALGAAAVDANDVKSQSEDSGTR